MKSAFTLCLPCRHVLNPFHFDLLLSIVGNCKVLLPFLAQMYLQLILSGLHIELFARFSHHLFLGLGIVVCGRLSFYPDCVRATFVVYVRAYVVFVVNFAVLPHIPITFCGLFCSYFQD